MKKLTTLLSSDFRQIARDPTLSFFLVAPLLLIIFVRLFVPYITSIFPIIEAYHPVIIMFAAIQSAIMFGFIISFVILDEKDENVLQVIRVLPISPYFFLLYRLLFATVFSALGAFLMLTFCGIAYPGWVPSILLSIQYGLTAPLITLIVATFANNKVEGMAYFKGVDLVLLLPLLSFFVGDTTQYIFSIIPAFWTYQLLNASIAHGDTIYFFVVGLLFYMVAIGVLYVQFKKRVFDR